MKTVVGLFKSISEAQTAKQGLVSHGYNAEDIRVVANDQGSTGYSSGASKDTHETGVMASIKHFFSSLTEDTSSTDHEYYSDGVSRGGALLSATVPDEKADATLALLETYSTADYDQGTYTATPSTLAGATSASTAATSGGTSIPVVEEELQVGKREVSRGGVRVYSRVVETPVEEKIRLREEHVLVERIPVDRLATEADFQAFKDGSIELTESAEEAVVSKQARVVEEVTVGKEVSERTQTVRDSVRHTEVEVEELSPELTKKATASAR